MKIISSLFFLPVPVLLAVVPVGSFAALPISIAMISTSAVNGGFAVSQAAATLELFTPLLVFSAVIVCAITGASIYHLQSNMRPYATSALIAGAGISTMSFCGLMLGTISDIKNQELYTNIFTTFIKQDSFRTLLLQSAEPGLILGVIAGSLAIVGAFTYAIAGDKISAKIDSFFNSTGGNHGSNS